MRYSTKLVLGLLFAFALAASSAFASGGLTVDMDNGENIYNNGKEDTGVPACQGCHMPDGMGSDDLGTPRLAGQIFQFIVKQMEDYALDKREDTTMYIMNSNAKGLTSQERLDVAAYISQWQHDRETVDASVSDLNAIKANGVEVGETHLGKAIVNHGISEKGVAACRSCHDYNGRGVEPLFPMIGQQKYTYLVAQMKQWREGTRSNDPQAIMRNVAKNMSDEDINNVAAYLSTKEASPYSLGNSRLPHRFTPFETHH
ncbi:MAG: c-type cytochrome [Gammaproteobacteria bacterium]|nr:c-type cytochrome [Gammaproteobacteria bacterium]